VIANDTGPAHLAAAVGTPLLSLLGPTQAGQWLPWGAAVDFVQGNGQSWPDLASVLSAVKKKLAAQAFSAV
jgi:heptosyltransferase-2